MILKAHEINKINPNTNKFILFYGENEGYKNQSIKNLTQNVKIFCLYQAIDFSNMLPKYYLEISPQP